MNRQRSESREAVAKSDLTRALSQTVAVAPTANSLPHDAHMPASACDASSHLPSSGHAPALGAVHAHPIRVVPPRRPTTPAPARQPRATTATISSRLLPRNVLRSSRRRRRRGRHVRTPGTCRRIGRYGDPPPTDLITFFFVVCGLA